jgi:hypothetical protein
MTGVPFYVENTRRSYPLVDNGPLDMFYSAGGSLELPKDAIADFTCLVGPDMDYAEDTHVTYLYEVRREGESLAFEFRFTAPLLLDQSLTFCRDVEDMEYPVDREDSFTNELAVPVTATLDCGGFAAEGWLTTGTLDILAGMLSDGQYLRRADANVFVEPAQVRSLRKTFVKSVSLINEVRTLAAPADACGPDPNTTGHVINAACVTGPLRWIEGYNCLISQDPTSSKIQIQSFVGGGEGQPCEEVSLFAGETPPVGSTLLTGGPTCNDVVRTINGVGGPDIVITAGTGVAITPDDADIHKLNITPDLLGLELGTLLGTGE